MVARSRIAGEGGPGNAAGYYMRATEDHQTRDRDRALLRLPGGHELAGRDGTIPLIRQDASRAMRISMGVTREAPSAEQVGRFLAGRTLAGAPTGRRKLAAHTRPDGATFQPRPYVDWVFRADTTWGLALAGAATPHGRALILGAFEAAADEGMRHLESRAGVTRKMVNRQPFELNGEIFYLSFTHHATRQLANGDCMPCLHRHNATANFVLCPGGEFGAMHMKRLTTYHAESGLYFQDQLQVQARRIGLDTVRHPENKLTMIADIPAHVRDAFMLRGKEREEYARNLAAQRGIDFGALDTPSQYRIADAADAIARRGRADGRADAAQRQSWLARAVRLGWTPGDLARPSLSPRLTQTLESPSLSLAERARALRQRVQAVRLGIGQRIAAGAAMLSPRLMAGMAGLSRALDSLSDQIQKIRNQTRALNQSILINEHILKNTLKYSASQILVHSIERLVNGMSDVATASRRLVTSHEFAEGQVLGLGQYLSNKYRLEDSGIPSSALGAASEILARPRAQPLEKLAETMANNANFGSNQEYKMLAAKLIDALMDGKEIALRMVDNHSTGTTFIRGEDKRAIGFASSLADGAMLSEMTKMSVVVAYNDANKAAAIARESKANPDRPMVNMVSDQPGAAVAAQKLRNETGAIPMISPQGNGWQDAVKEMKSYEIVREIRTQYVEQKEAAGISMDAQGASRQEGQQSKTMQLER